MSVGGWWLSASDSRLSGSGGFGTQQTGNCQRAIKKAVVSIIHCSREDQSDGTEDTGSIIFVFPFLRYLTIRIFSNQFRKKITRKNFLNEVFCCTHRIRNSLPFDRRPYSRCILKVLQPDVSRASKETSYRSATTTHGPSPFSPEGVLLIRTSVSDPFFSYLTKRLDVLTRSIGAPAYYFHI